MKKIILFAFLILNFQFLILNSLRAQGFEWVRTYTGPDISSGVAANNLKGSCVDTAGNLYILGEFSPQAQLCGVNLLPREVIVTPRNSAVVIAKLSPSGELLWHKAIYNGKVSDYAYALRMMGDSCIMAMVMLYTPYDVGGYNEYRNLYYLDTLLTGNSDYLIPNNDSVSRQVNAFITFDFDGNVTEQHFVRVGFTDTLGNDLTPRFMGNSHLVCLSTSLLSGENFNIDSEGNIYVIRSVHADEKSGRCDTCPDRRRYWRLWEGTIGAMKIVVDSAHILTYPIPHPTARWNQQILKFSPHFDSILDAVYMFDSTLNRQCGTIKVNSFLVDAQNNLYLAMQGTEMPSHLRIFSPNSLYLGDSLTMPKWIIKYNSNLETTGLAQLSCSISNISNARPLAWLMYPYIDNNTNTIFVSGLVGWTPRYDTVDHIFYNQDTLDFPNETSFWLRLNLDDLRLLSYGVRHPGNEGKGSVPSLTACNNRVLAQNAYLFSMVFCDTTWYTDYSSWDVAFLAWDYNGHEIGVISRYNVHGPRKELYSPIVIDSVVYLTGSLVESATFDTITTHNQGSSQVYIAKYVDPEFARPYVHPSDRQEQTIEWQQDLVFALADSPVTLTATATSGLPVSYTSSDSTIAYVEGDRLHLVADGYAWLTATQDGDYQYFPAEPVQRLLTVGNVGIATVTADGQAKAYPNPTSGKVTIDLAQIPPAPPLPYQRPRPSDTSDVDMVLYTSPGAPFPQYETCRFPYHQRYNMKVSGSALQSHDGVVTAWLTDMQGRREEVVLTPTGPDRYTLDLTSRPPVAYLLTVTTADGRELTFRLMKQYGRK